MKDSEHKRNGKQMRWALPTSKLTAVSFWAVAPGTGTLAEPGGLRSWRNGVRDWRDKGGQPSQQSVLERRESLRENPETGMQTMPLENVANDQYMHAKN